MVRTSKSVALDAPIDLNLLAVFLEVARVQSFSEAARALELRRSSVSRAVASLEASLGVQLFSRTTRRVELTTAGAALAAKVGPQLLGLRESLGDLPEREDVPSGRLRISAAHDLGVTVLPLVVSAFCTRYPQVQVEVSLSNRQVDLVAERFDIALRVAAGARLKDSSLVARKLSALELQLFASPTYLAREGTPRTADELADHEWVLFKNRALPPPLLTPRRKPRVVSDDIFFCFQAVKAGSGIGGVPSFIAREEVARGTLVRVTPRLSLGVGTLFLVHPPAQHLARKVSAFSDFVVEHLARFPLG